MPPHLWSVVFQNESNRLNGLKTIAMRLRSTKGEVEALDDSIDTDGMLTDITKVQNQLLNYTHGAANIMDMNGEFRSTYDILTDIASVWPELTSVEQADVCLCA